MKQKKVSNVNIPGTNNIHGYLEKLPDDYNSTTKKYPLLIFIHGVDQGGPGTDSSLCKLLGEWWWTPSSLSERASNPVFPASVLDQFGQIQKYIVITPQMVNWQDVNGTVNALITHLLGKYRADPARVYLTGLSAGGNYVHDYATYSLANAKRIAALIPVAPCNTISAQGAKFIADADLAYWGIQCSIDDRCAGTNVMNAANLINSQNPAPTPLAYHTTFAPADCPQNEHEVWGIAYNPAFRQTINGRSVNVYEWAVQYSRSALLPVALENYTVILRDGKVHVRWTTSSESNNARFNIERSADGKQFIDIATIPAVGNASGKAYEWIDERPLANLSYYRLTQTDLNDHTEKFQIRKILNRSVSDRAIIVAPNPFTTELTAYINVPQTQLVTINVADISGRVLKTVSGKYAEGAAEITVSTTELPKGIYFLKVKGESFTQTQKVIKQ
ncbi:T9SS type A sorting domain-containing protein [Pseudoflavitalea sp. X16]|uniref:T9SS type A sorting domain-containing protein n=1 Tax=Paraflavitalea devenefica TaxID=2716334 RepID=UPI00141E6D99|nr:T9SS type A sorting domain-containing protein [Paraflavitalea devenefica]NII24261.1 T9SS type A sorting domain-containing protein [Paraflavitalea devenefica]